MSEGEGAVRLGRPARKRVGGMPPRRKLAALVSVLVAAALAPWPAFAQPQPEARSIVEAALEKRAERFAGVENYTVIQTLQGAEVTLYFERLEADGYPVFRVVPPHEYQGEALAKAGLAGGAEGTGTGIPAGGGPGRDLPPGVPGLPAGVPEIPAGLPGIPGVGGLPDEAPGGAPGGALQRAGGAALGAAGGGLQQHLAQKGMQALMGQVTAADDDGAEEAMLALRGLEDLAGTARLEGTEVVDGAECYVLRTGRIEDPELARRMGGGSEFALRELTIWVDVEELVSRRTRAVGEVTAGGQPQEMTIEVLEQDYRDVDGMLEPFRRVIRVSGMGAMLAAEDPGKAAQIQKDMQENMEKLRHIEEMLARMPPEQRRMAEAQMKQAMPQMRQLAEGGLEDAEVVTEVKELRVNAGPPTPFGTGAVSVRGEAELELPYLIAHATPGADPAGRASGWVIQLMGAVEGQAGGVVQLAVTGGLPASGHARANGGASFRWEGGSELQLVAPEGGVSLTIGSRDATRISGEFSFRGTGQLQGPDGAREASGVVRGRFEVPLPPSAPPGRL